MTTRRGFFRSAGAMIAAAALPAPFARAEEATCKEEHETIEATVAEDGRFSFRLPRGYNVERVWVTVATEKCAWKVRTG